MALLDVDNVPETVDRFCRERADTPGTSRVSAALCNFREDQDPHPDRNKAIRQLVSCARPVIDSDGDRLFQGHKMRFPGVEAALEARIRLPGSERRVA